ncbi:hypothetical protein PROFUN_06552 [Planoprotostelium fungivorum]|uniref:D-xylose 1-dehydrogenase (NADP(+), D-xylono-1,5-lactone-forming) n=1 Tax=Planoprotostelium fungivorum TaxID=1890364 RepID=A0A2P6MRW1_9EUKA|nr:hypothetical protein PROFUN_06552 [Planoprotostelium fungivorum]
MWAVDASCSMKAADMDNGTADCRCSGFENVVVASIPSTSDNDYSFEIPPKVEEGSVSSQTLHKGKMSSHNMQQNEPGFFKRIWMVMTDKPVAKTENPLRIGILGAANIAPNAVITPASQMSNVIIASVAARDPIKAQEYARKHHIPEFHTDYEALIRDPNIDAIYNPLPNGLHYEWTKKAILAGKHVLIEKPCTSNAEQAREIFELASKHNVKVMEAFHYAFHPAVRRFGELIHSGAIGDVQSVKVNMTFPNFFKADDIRFNYKLAGGLKIPGTFMDAGCYVLHMGRFIMGEDPVSVVDARPTVLHDKIDIEMEADLAFSRDRTLHLIASFNKRYVDVKSMLPKAIVQGTKGTITLSNWIAPSYWHSISVEAEGQTRKEKVYREGWTTYRYQLEEFVNAVRGRETSRWITAEDSIGNMKWIDEVYEKSGLGRRESRDRLDAELFVDDHHRRIVKLTLASSDRSIVHRNRNNLKGRLPFCTILHYASAAVSVECLLLPALLWKSSVAVRKQHTTAIIMAPVAEGTIGTPREGKRLHKFACEQCERVPNWNKGDGKCKSCKGQGNFNSGPCRNCNGTGKCLTCNGMGRMEVEVPANCPCSIAPAVRPIQLFLCWMSLLHFHAIEQQYSVMLDLQLLREHFRTQDKPAFRNICLGYISGVKQTTLNNLKDGCGITNMVHFHSNNPGRKLWPLPGANSKKGHAQFQIRRACLKDKNATITMSHKIEFSYCGGDQVVTSRPRVIGWEEIPGTDLLVVYFDRPKLTETVKDCKKGHIMCSLLDGGDEELYTYTSPPGSFTYSRDKPKGELRIVQYATRLKVSWGHKHDTFSRSQKGFLRYEGCHDHTFVLKAINAFGSMPHRYLFLMTRLLGLPAYILPILKDMYTEATLYYNLPNGDRTRMFRMKKGVKQGDPLSPIVFNMGMEALLRLLETSEGYTFHQNRGDTSAPITVKSGTFADDLVALNQTLRGWADTSSKITTFGKWTGVRFGIKKCAVFPQFYIDTKLATVDIEYKLDGETLPCHTIDNFYKYLGSDAGYYPNQPQLEEKMASFREKLIKIARSDLLPHQMVRLIQGWLSPSLEFLMRNNDFRIKELEVLDRDIRDTLRGVLILPKWTSNAWWYAPKDIGGLGLTPLTDLKRIYRLLQLFRSLTNRDPVIRHIIEAQIHDTQRRRKVRTTDGESRFLDWDTTSDKLSETYDIRTLITKCIPYLERYNLWVTETARGIWQLRRGDGEKMHETGCYNPGRTARVLKEKKPTTASIKWVHAPGPLWPEEYNWAIKARLRLHPCLSIRKMWDPTIDDQCRRCGKAKETLNHILGNCLYTMDAIRGRHDRINRFLEDQLKPHWPQVLHDQRTILRGNLQRPDLQLINSDTSTYNLLELRLTREDVGCYDVAYQHKWDKYQPIVRQLRGKGYDVNYCPIIIGFTGIIPEETIKKFSESTGLPIAKSRSILTTASHMAIRGSWKVWQALSKSKGKCQRVYELSRSQVSSNPAATSVVPTEKKRKEKRKMTQETKPSFKKQKAQELSIERDDDTSPPYQPSSFELNSPELDEWCLRTTDISSTLYDEGMGDTFPSQHTEMDQYPPFHLPDESIQELLNMLR